MNERIARLRAEMERAGLDAVLLKTVTAIRYFSGFTSEDASVLITKNRSALLTDFRYTIQAKAQAGDCCEIIEVSGLAHNEKLKEIVESENVRRMGFEEDYVSYAGYQAFAKFGAELVPFAKELSLLRIRKSADEIECLQKAQEMADKAFTELLKVVKPGMTERRVAAELEYICAKLGSEGPSFETIVGSGPNGAMCHAVPGERKLQEGDLVVLDYGCLYNGYHSDMTRTFAVGKVDPFAEEIYNIVLEAQTRALDALKPGITGKELDAIARDYIAEKGYGDCFGHSLGHGFGLLIHEEPRASVTGDTVFEEGMTITVEPGIYIEDKFGVRIEDCCVVTKDGKRNFAHATKELQHI